MLIKQQNYLWCTFAKQTTGPVPHHSPAASGPPPAPEPTPASTSTSSSNAPPALPSTTENLIDLDSPAPAHIHGLMAELNINKWLVMSCNVSLLLFFYPNYVLRYTYFWFCNHYIINRIHVHVLTHTSSCCPLWAMQLLPIFMYE